MTTTNAQSTETDVVGNGIYGTAIVASALGVILFAALGLRSRLPEPLRSLLEYLGLGGIVTITATTAIIWGVTSIAIGIHRDRRSRQIGGDQ